MTEQLNNNTLYTYINSSLLFTDKYILLYKYTTIVASIYLLMDIWMRLHWWQCRRHKILWVQSLGREHPLEEEMATHTSILAGKIPWTEKPGGLQSIGSQRVRHNGVRTHGHLDYSQFWLSQVKLLRTLLNKSL